MAIAATYKDVIVEIYEQHNEEHSVTSSEAAAGKLTVSGKQAHADAVGTTTEVLRTRVYIDGVRATITEVANVSSDIEITISAPTLTLNQLAEIYVPTTTGSLTSNATSGKLTLPTKQVSQEYNVRGDELRTGGLGTKAKDTYVFATSGDITIGLEKKNSTALKDMTDAMENNVFLSLVIKDTHASSAEYRILNAANVTGYGESVANTENARGIVMETFTFGFKSPVDVATA